MTDGTVQTLMEERPDEEDDVQSAERASEGVTLAVV